MNVGGSSGGLPVGGLSTPNKISIWNHMFRFDTDDRDEVMNTLQYVFLALIPVVIMNKIMGHWVPAADERKSTVEIVLEVAMQILFIFAAKGFIHRLITYFPTYSGKPYPTVHLIRSALGFMILVLTLQSKLGDKINILAERFYELWHGKQPSAGKRITTSAKPHGPQHPPMQTAHQPLPPVVDPSFAPPPTIPDDPPVAAANDMGDGDDGFMASVFG